MVLLPDSRTNNEGKIKLSGSRPTLGGRSQKIPVPGDRIGRNKSDAKESETILDILWWNVAWLRPPKYESNLVCI